MKLTPWWQVVLELECKSISCGPDQINDLFVFEAKRLEVINRCDHVTDL